MRSNKSNRTSSTLNDHIYTNFDENISRVHVCKIPISDHYAVFGNRQLNNCIKTNTHQTVAYRSFKNFEETMFINDLREVSWETIEAFEDINETVEVWDNMFLEVVNKHAPIKSHRTKRNYQPAWLTPQILDCIKQRNKCKVSWKMDVYLHIRNRVSKMIDSAKNETYQMKIEEGKNDPRSVW